MNIIIASGGRRAYLVEWFQEAMVRNKVKGRVIVTDADPLSAAFAAGDISVQMPKYDDPEYCTEMLSLASERSPSLLISLNDYELEILAKGLSTQLEDLGVVVSGLPNRIVSEVTDKLRMHHLLTSYGIPTPATEVASQVLAGESQLPTSERYIVKHRWGSGSSGLKIEGWRRLQDAIRDSMSDAPRRGRASPADSVVVQPCVRGQEFGIDLVGTLTGVGDLAGILVRRKLKMRAGETAQAVTVPSDAFDEIGHRLFSALQPRGIIDVDYITDGDGNGYVIDVNPRFGGGYPFNHMAGANVPDYYLSSLLKTYARVDSLNYAAGIASSKFEGIRRVANGGRALELH